MRPAKRSRAQYCGLASPETMVLAPDPSRPALPMVPEFASVQNTAPVSGSSATPTGPERPDTIVCGIAEADACARMIAPASKSAQYTVWDDSITAIPNGACAAPAPKV